MPAAAAAMANWAGPRKRGTRRDSAMPMSRKVMVHSEFSSTLPRKFVVITAYQEQISATHDDGHDGLGDVFRGVGVGDLAQRVEHDGPLRGKA